MVFRANTLADGFWTKVLTPKQKIFVKEYLVDLNATRAAISAGYSKKTAYSQGQRLLKHVEVSAELAESTQKRAGKLDISAEYVLGMIKQTVERCSQGVEVCDREGNPTGEWKEDSFAVLKGCELLGKHLKLFTDKIEHSGLDKLPDVLARARQRSKDASSTIN